MTDSIIIGAGAAGLAAARVLGKAGKSVIVLEARDRIGGRIHTLHENNFSSVVEAGAEFMHGDLPHTLALMNEAGVKYRKADGKVWNVKNGDLHEGDFFDDGWNELIQALKNLKEDTTIANFLDTQFADSKYDSLRQSIIRFVQGYDAADATKASAFALRDEWTSEGDFSSYHIEGGYGQLMEFIQNDCVNHGVTFHLLSIVKQINWRKGTVEVITEQGTSYTASHVLVTIPPAVLKSGAITFTPAIDTHMNAIHKIETGGVIKFLVELKEPYWQKPELTELRAMPGMHFIFSDAFIPTWWSQSPSPVPLLTGWLAGPVTQSIQKSEEELMKEVLHVLAYLFACKVSDVETKIRAAKVIDWMQDPFSLGAYAYRTLDTNKAIDLLSKPIEDTIFFAGEAYYSGPEMGTVEAALVSGAHRASLILNAD